ncbi:MAG: PadR family transcriptional regulator [Angustibacter sp.]
MTTLGYAILGLLADGPRTGYEIARRMDTPIGYYWTARHSQIYPELARLEADHLVRHEVVPGPGPRDTKRYTLTRAGRTTLRQWVASPLPPQPERSELLLRTRWLWLTSPEQAADFLRTVRAERQRRLETYREEERRVHSSAGTSDELADPTTAAFWRLATITNGLSYEEHLVRWCDQLLAALTAAPAR